MINDAFFILGFYGPILIGLIGAGVLWSNTWFLVVYLLSILGNVGVNKILKLSIRDPRPTKTGGLSSVVDTASSYSGEEKWGMPSGHAQTSFFCITFLFLYNESVELAMGLGSLAFLTLLQRWTNKRHTVAQLVVGSIVGIAVANMAFYVGKLTADTS